MLDIQNQEPLPEWAAAIASGRCLSPMQQLYTRDGSRRGNATLVRVYQVTIDTTTGVITPCFEVVTDANSWSRMTYNELMEAYTPGKYILNSFPNPLSAMGNPR